MSAAIKIVLNSFVLALFFTLCDSPAAEPSAAELKRKKQWEQLKISSEKARRDQEADREGMLLQLKMLNATNRPKADSQIKSPEQSSGSILKQLDQLIAETPEVPKLTGKVLQVLDKKTLLIKLTDADPDQSIVALIVLDTAPYVDGDAVSVRANPVEPLVYVSVTGAKRKVKAYAAIE